MILVFGLDGTTLVGLGAVLAGLGSFLTGWAALRVARKGQDADTKQIGSADGGKSHPGSVVGDPGSDGTECRSTTSAAGDDDNQT
jgi:hypothetical protein